MKYMLVLIGEEGDSGDATPEEMKAEMDRWSAYDEEVNAAGVFVAGEGLTPSSETTTMRVSADGEERTTMDGPFAETKEQIGGFYVLDCESLDEALEWARKVPVRGGAIEVRPVIDYEAYGNESPEALDQGVAS